MNPARVLCSALVVLLFQVWETFAFDYDYVTCGSALKLVNDVYKVRLHSHDVKYGSGSGQQSVTGMSGELDGNSYWQVRGGMKKDCLRGSPIKCGQTIRLTHLATRKNLHSHHFSSPMSHEQEVSAFGDDGKGDDLDEWVLVCDGKHWDRRENVRIKHKETQAYLSCTAKTYGRPINGQQEIVSSHAPTKASNYWKAMGGVYIKPSEEMSEKWEKRNSEEQEIIEPETEYSDIIIENKNNDLDQGYDEPEVKGHEKRFLDCVFDYFRYIFRWVEKNVKNLVETENGGEL